MKRTILLLPWPSPVAGPGRRAVASAPTSGRRARAREPSRRRRSASRPSSVSGGSEIAGPPGDVHRVGHVQGPARDQFERAELEKRLIVMQGCYDGEKHTIIDEQPGDNGKRILRVELTKGPVTKTPRFTTVKGPSDRWYVEDADFAAVTALCRRERDLEPGNASSLGRVSIPTAR